MVTAVPRSHGRIHRTNQIVSQNIRMVFIRSALDIETTKKVHVKGYRIELIFQIADNSNFLPGIYWIYSVSHARFTLFYTSWISIDVSVDTSYEIFLIRTNFSSVKGYTHRPMIVESEEMCVQILTRVVTSREFRSSDVAIVGTRIRCNWNFSRCPEMLFLLDVLQRCLAA